jgi:L-glyceraldehyde 3-phosphate reductase
VASLDQSLKRMGLDYVDIFYHHRPDLETPVEETLEALDIIVRQGKALYAGVSSYQGAQFVQAAETARRRGWAPITIHQPRYHMLERWVEHDLLAQTNAYGTGVIAFCPLAQGVLTSKYLDPATPLPKESRAADPDGYLQPGQVTPMIGKVRALNEIAKCRGQSMAQMALSWVLRTESVTSALIGASRPAQITECVGALANLAFSEKELAEIDKIALG